jgi:sugar-specific transcriptional regulator TrmB
MKDTQTFKPSNTTPKTPHSHALYERLQASGMHHDQAMVYGYLVEAGPTRAGTIAAQTRLSTTLVYRALEALESANLVTSNKRRAKSRSLLPVTLAIYEIRSSLASAHSMKNLP